MNWDLYVNDVLYALVPPEGPAWRVFLGLPLAVVVMLVFGVVSALVALVEADRG